jgi:hypothetical protein
MISSKEDVEKDYFAKKEIVCHQKTQNFPIIRLFLQPKRIKYIKTIGLVSIAIYFDF